MGMSGRLTQDQFLVEMISGQTATVDATELRNLLMEVRKLRAANIKLTNQNDIMAVSITALKRELQDKESRTLYVSGIDIKG